MKKIYSLAAITVVFFLAELVFMTVFGRWLRPNLLILLIIFIDLHLGVRYGIFVALLAGLLKDSFSAGPLGMHTVSLILCVYIITLIRRFIFYDVEFGFLRILMAFVMSLLNVIIYYCLYAMLFTVDFAQMVVFVLLPEVLATTAMAALVFRELKRCVLKLSV